jgi:hypothetical protein
MGNSTGEHGSLVVTGSSAGGIEALSVLLSALPADFRAPIVVTLRSRTVRSTFTPTVCNGDPSRRSTCCSRRRRQRSANV